MPETTSTMMGKITAERVLKKLRRMGSVVAIPRHDPAIKVHVLEVAITLARSLSIHLLNLEAKPAVKLETG